MLTPAEIEFGAALMHYEEMVQKHPDGGEEFGKARRRVLDLFRLTARSPRDEPDSVGALISSLEDHIAREDMPNIRRTLTALKYAHQKDLRRAAPSVEARDADADLWELGQAYIAFHDLCRQDASEAAINAALAHRNELQARIASLLPPEKT